MSSDIAVGIFLQRLLHEKYMEDSKVDVLLQSVIRGVGLNFTTKSSFIQYANNLLSDVGFMLVRVIVAGKRYYSLKDLDSINIGESMQSENAVYLLSQDDLKTPTRKLRDLQNSELATFTQNSTLSESRHVTPFKLYGSKFTNTELIIFIDCINTIIETGKPLSLKNNGTLNTWCYVCSKRSLIDDSAQFALFCRFERKKWLEYEDSGTSIAPGIRFYFELTDLFNLRNIKTCKFCNGLIIYHEVICSVCHNSFHTNCMDTNKLETGNEICYNCNK